ncbi:late competence development ComFB family protein [Aerosakkonema sp. BLCC-F183]|uniref:late competence development ComFB family protein n=1 Tax=Aerosakkonema sp. BLCC-F183 TaxID=3342834 RepID=UPI0035B885FA
MNTLISERCSRYCNVLEPLVAEEVERQLQNLPPKLLKYINPAQVAAYALNRLPALYATSVEGWQRQQQRANKELRSKITEAVRQGLAAVQRDPLRVATPLNVCEEIEVHEEQVTEEDLQAILKYSEMFEERS